MSTDPITHLRSNLRSAMLIGGLISILVGVALLVWPKMSASVMAAVLGVYALVAGLAYIGVGFASLSRSGWSRVGNILLGALYVVAAIVFFSNLQAASAMLVLLVTVMIGVIWVVEGVTAFTTIPNATSKAWAFFYGFLSIIAGLFILFSPLYSALVLWIIVGISAIVLGVVQVVRSFLI